MKKQVLLYLSMDARLNHPSIETYGKGYFLPHPLIQWLADPYKRKDEDILDPLMSPLFTEDVSQLPPVFVCMAEKIRKRGRWGLCEKDVGSR
ncbi:MAG: alpha/beta hydrolase fold domain-containing protein [Bacteroidia bacterium]|nr:alpha/beta hydrolase fold domain-containing protein [Bacteroidia bacterium]